MGIPAIDRNSLARMEYMLYGGASGLGSCPSYANGYNSGINSYNMYQAQGFYPSFYGYPGYPGYANNSIYDNYQNSASQQAPATTFGASQADLDVLGKYYIKGLAPSESLAGAAVGGVTFAMMNNPRSVVHWWNFLKASKETEALFAGVKKEGSSLYKLWRNPETTNVMQEAYARMHKLEALNFSKLGLFRKRIDPAKYESLKKVMTEALNFSGPEAEKLKKIAEATELIKKETNAFTGHIPNLLRKMGLQKPMTNLRTFINGDQYKPVAEIAAKNLAESGKAVTLKQCLKKGCGIKSALFFAGIELLMGIPNIKEAFKTQNMSATERQAQGLGDKKYDNAGWKQLGQTLTKGIGSAIGWGIGEGIGVWAAMKVGTIAGTAVAPGVGTVIGAVAGLVGGSIGMWLTGKITHKIVGNDIAENIKVDKMKTTPEGQAELLSSAMEQAKTDKNLDIRTAQAIQNLGRLYVTSQA